MPVIVLGLAFAALPSQALASAKGKPKTKVTLNQDPVFSGQVASAKPCMSNRAVELIAPGGTVVGMARTNSAGRFFAASSFHGRAYATVDKASRRKGGKKVRCGASRSGERVLGEADVMFGIFGINPVAGMPRVWAYALRVWNQGPGAATNVVVSAQTYTNGGTFVSSVPAICGGLGNFANCPVGTLSPGASVDITVRFGPCAGDLSFGAYATTSTFDPDSSWNGDAEAVNCPL